MHAHRGYCERHEGVIRSAFITDGGAIFNAIDRDKVFLN
eukprot:SAG25_NODE_991_length_4387_cov_1.733442_1_plen_38_part_10